MNSIEKITHGTYPATGAAKRYRVQTVVAVALALLMSGPAFAQYSGGTMGGAATTGGYVPPKGGYKTSTGVGIAAGAAAGAGILYYVMHSRNRLAGCVQSSNDGLSLVDDKHNQTYSLEGADGDVKAGERVQLKGKKVKDSSGAQSFQVRSVVRHLGSCQEAAALGSSHAASR